MGQHIDVCNGDADGLCAVLQWRLADPQPARLVTGLKRDIALLDRVQAGSDDAVLVCDVSLPRNLSALQRLLAAGASVTYFDHHASGPVPTHPRLQAHLAVSERTCTCLLMDDHLGHCFSRWALVGAYGDAIDDIADALADGWGLAPAQRQSLQALGRAINHNAYGDSEADALVPPAQLYATLIKYADPLDYLLQEPLAQALIARRMSDLQQARAQPPFWSDGQNRAYLLPDAPWSRRASGSLANELAAHRPGGAHAVLRSTGRGHYLVSVRAPLHHPQGAEVLCRRFGGGGRAAAAGIDRLPTGELQRFLLAFARTDWGEAATLQATPA
ncbi:MAG: hypothetical protein RIS90_2387 [Pseudomonadota bacterium]|jgi:hypothetical protein